MLNTVEIVNSQGQSLVLPLNNDGTGIYLRGMEGLDPVKANLVSSSFANMDGAQYNSSRRESRNIKVMLGLDPDFSKETVRTLRRDIYNFCMPKTEVLLRFHVFDEFDTNIISQNNIFEIVARVESCESPLFEKDPAVDISLMCFDPDFLVPTPVVVPGNSTAGTTEFTVDYTGTVETGLIFQLLVNRAMDSGFTIYHRPPDGTLRQVDFTSPLESGDVLTINTNWGSKSVIRSRAGVDSSLLYGMTPQSTWLELLPGLNHFRVYATGAAVPFQLSYTIRQGGL